MRVCAGGKGREGSGASCDAFGYRWCIAGEWASLHLGMRVRRSLVCAGSWVHSRGARVVHMSIPGATFAEGLEP